MAAGVVAEGVPAVIAAGTMVPVAIVAERRRRRWADRKDIIEIASGSGARVSLRGVVEPAVLRPVIELLR